MTTYFKATYFDGKSSRAHDVDVQLDHGIERLVLRGTTIGKQAYPISEVKVAARVGNTPRFLYFDDGASLETAENDAVDEIVPALRHGRFHLAQHRVESKLGWITAICLLTIAIGWGTVSYGVPFLAKQVAFALPRDVDEQLGQGTMSALDEFAFKPSTLSKSDRDRLQQYFQELLTLSDLKAGEVELLFRASPVMGANALALPSGIVVMTDELVRLAHDDEEIIAVFAHEIGHIRERHSLRGVLQNSSVALLIAGATGDIAALTSIAATLPTLMVQLKYSRSFELEADDYAVDLLKQREIEPTKLGDILLRMTEMAGGDVDPAREGAFSDYLSTHPNSVERMQRIEEREAE